MRTESCTSRVIGSPVNQARAELFRLHMFPAVCGRASRGGARLGQEAAGEFIFKSAVISLKLLQRHNYQ